MGQGAQGSCPQSQPSSITFYPRSSPAKPSTLFSVLSRSQTLGYGRSDPRAMATKEASPVAQQQDSPQEEHTSPKKRRKVNHGGYDSHIPWILIAYADKYLGSMCLLSSICKHSSSPATMSSAPTSPIPLQVHMAHSCVIGSI